MKKGFSNETPGEGKTNDWITPKWIIDAFDSLVVGRRYFDIDPCSSVTQPWSCAEHQFNVRDNGMLQDWNGNVWLNPPYGPHALQWVQRLSHHKGGGITLIFARLETKVWQHHIFPTADAYFFPSARIKFYTPQGIIADGTGGAPSALVAWGKHNVDAITTLLKNRKFKGAMLDKAVFYRGL